MEQERTPKSGGFRQFKAERPTIYLISIVMMAINGAASPLLSKYAYSFQALPCNDPNACEPQYFGDFMALTWLKYITITMMSIGIWCWDLKRFKNYQNSNKQTKPPYFSSVPDIIYNSKVPKSRWFLILLCSLFDVGFSICQRSALLFTHAANVQLISNFIVILSAFIKMLIPKEALLIREWIAVLIITVGLACTSIDSFINAPTNVDAAQSLLGIGLAFASSTCKALQVNIEHKFYRKYRYPPMKFMSISGFFSVLLCFFMSIGYYYTGVVDFRAGFWMVINSQAIFWVAVWAATTAAWFNLASAIVQKFTSSVHREVFSMNAVIFTWLGEVVLGIREFEWITFVAEIAAACGVIFHSGIWKNRMPKQLEKPITCRGRLTVQEGLVLDPSVGTPSDLPSIESNSVSEHKSDSQ